MPTSPTSPRRLRAPAVWIGSIAALLAAGCEEERHDAFAPKAKKTASVPAKKADEPVFIVGKRTQEIKNAGPAIQSGQAQQVQPRITAKDPITLQGNAYVTAIGQIAIGNIKHTMDLYQAENGKYPATYDEFMEEIIRKGQIALPRLPHYQKYSYDPAEHKLVILEYPDLKGQPPR